ncbi:MAG: hypothetical protein QXX95_07520 [Nitrososphaerales archaeon]
MNLKEFFLELPKDIEEAALIDGATYFNILRKIITSFFSCNNYDSSIIPYAILE